MTVKLLTEGLSRDEVVERIVSDNLFQYPTEKSVRRMALTCLRRLDALEDDSLVVAIANRPQDTVKQICLYAMMKLYRLIWDFMITETKIRNVERRDFPACTQSRRHRNALFQVF